MRDSEYTFKEIVLFTWKSIRSYKCLFFFLVLSSLTWAFDSTFMPYIFRRIIDHMVEHEEVRSTAWNSLRWIFFGWIGFWICLEIGFRLQGFLLAKLLPHIEADLRMQTFDHVQHHSPHYFNERFAGNLANKITDITTQIPAMITQVMNTFLPTTASFFLACFFLWQVNPLFSVLLMMGIVIHLGICFFFMKKCDTLERVHSEIRSSLLGRIVDSLTNNLSVNLFFRFRNEYALVHTIQAQEQHSNYQAKKYVEIMKLFFGLFTFLIGGVAINGSMVYFWMQGRISTGEVAQILNTSGNILMAMWWFSMTVPSFYQSLGITKQALSVWKEPQDVVDVPGAKPLVVTKGEIVFDKVDFHYGERHLFQNKDVHIKAGERVGLVGYSGSGKSTFIALILRMYLVRSGKILIDGQDISQVSLDSLRSQISLIPQDPLLFHRTVEENIRYGKIEATQEEIVRAAKMAHCEEFIGRLPLQYDTEVGERGTKLSGGERQRIAIARAILKNAPLLILDEATSALDSVTEKYIHESLMNLMTKRTSIVIAHRLSTLSEMDRILVFDQGKIVEMGDHFSLLAQTGHYAKMWKMQAEGFMPAQPIE